VIVMPDRQTIVIGVGSELRGDAGFGAAMIEMLRKAPGLAGRVQFARCDGEPAGLIELWDGYGCAVVIDAVRGGGERFGYLCRHDLSADALLGSSRPWPAPPSGRGTVTSAHAVRLGHVLGRLPDRLILYAVHGRDFRLGARLSGPVEAAVPMLAGRISRDVLGLLPECARQGTSGGALERSNPVKALRPQVRAGA
jgi:hydrogenase maturation protease